MDKYAEKAQEVLAVFPHDSGKSRDVANLAQTLREVAAETWLEAAKYMCWMCAADYPIEHVPSYPTGSLYSAWVHGESASTYNRMCRAQEHHQQAEKLRTRVGAL